MSTNTANYNLVKPSGAPGGDLVDVAVINNNMDIIDTALHAHDLTDVALDARLDTLEAMSPGGIVDYPVIIKAADQNVISSIALVNDTHFVFAVPAVGTYEIDLDLILVGAAAADIRVGANFPGAGPCQMSVDGLDPSVAATNGTISRQTTAITSGVDPGVGLGVNPTAVWARVKFILVATATGNFNFRWAQSVSTATNTTVKQYSLMKVRKIA